MTQGLVAVTQPWDRPLGSELITWVAEYLQNIERTKGEFRL